MHPALGPDSSRLEEDPGRVDQFADALMEHNLLCDCTRRAGHLAAESCHPVQLPSAGLHAAQLAGLPRRISLLHTSLWRVCPHFGSGRVHPGVHLAHFDFPAGGAVSGRTANARPVPGGCNQFRRRRRDRHAGAIVGVECYEPAAQSAGAVRGACLRLLLGAGQAGNS